VAYELAEIHGFRSRDEFERFERWISKLVDDGEIDQVAVERRYADASFEERWFRERDGARWRLVAPDVPFRGVFEPVISTKGD
jgi:hypothetical protein